MISIIEDTQKLHMNTVDAITFKGELELLNKFLRSYCLKDVLS